MPAPPTTAPDTETHWDEQLMAGALTMARRHLGGASPNPSVGAVLVQFHARPEKGLARPVIIARAVTGIGGTPHAEPQAIIAAGRKAKGATLYVTLEPCNHHGRTPPCTEAIIKAGIKRVVIAGGDHDQRVSGSGIKRLEEAGIIVTTGISSDQADDLNCGHTLAETEHRPFIILKSAVGADGLILPAAENEKGEASPRWVTTPLARQRGHLLRAECDHILIGSGTARADNPSLTCRLPGLSGRSPRPVVMDSHLKLNADLRLFDQAGERPTPLVICTQDAAKEKGPAYKANRHCELLPLPAAGGGRPDLKAMLAALVKAGCRRLLVEGGPTILAAFLEAGLFDQLNIFTGSEPAGKAGLPPFGERRLTDILKTGSLILKRVQKLKTPTDPLNIMYQYSKS